MDHLVLGKLDEGSNGDSFEGAFKDSSYDIKFNIEIDAELQVEVLKFTESIIVNVSEFDLKAKSVISRDLLDSYNNGWNEYDEIQEDGTIKTIVKPKLDSSEFSSKFELESITICGS